MKEVQASSFLKVRHFPLSHSMSLSKPTSKKRQGTEAPRKSKRLRSDQEEEVSWDFLQWAWQDTTKAPLTAVASSDAPVARWLGVQSLASIVTGKDGKVFVVNATSKRGLKFQMGYVEGYQKQTHVVMPLLAPRAVAELFVSKVAKEVLKSSSFLERLVQAGGDASLLHLSIEEVLVELNIYTPEEYESLVSFCKMCGGTEEGKLPLRVARVQGELVMALIDVVMLAKKCTYETAKKICRRLLRNDTDSICSQYVNMHKGLNGGQKTACVPLSCLEVAALTWLAPLQTTKKLNSPIKKDHLYIMQYSNDKTVVKIGRSNNIKNRKLQLEACHNFRILVLAVYRFQGHYERNIHRILKKYRSKSGPGKEWFCLSAAEATSFTFLYILKRSRWVKSQRERRERNRRN